MFSNIFQQKNLFFFHLSLFIFSFIFTFIFSLLFHLASSLVFLLSSSLLSSLLFSCLSYSLFSSLLLSRLPFSCLVLSSLFYSCLVSLSLSLSFSVSVCLCLSLSLSVWCCALWCCVVCVVVVVLCVRVCVVCLCVCLCVLRHAEKREKTRLWIQKRLRVCIQNVPVCAGTTRTCVSTCARGAGIHRDVFNQHTGTFAARHTEGVLYIHHTHGVQGVIVDSAYQNLPTYGYHVI